MPHVPIKTAMGVLAVCTLALIGSHMAPPAGAQSRRDAPPATPATPTPTSTPARDITTYFPLLGRSPLMVVGGCPSPVQRPDAAIIADGILERESNDLLLDPQQRAELNLTLEPLLNLIRESEPAVSAIHAREPYAAGELLMSLRPALLGEVKSMLAGHAGPVAFETGYAAFDALNHRARLRGVELHPFYAHLCFDDLLNPPAASEAYLALDEVESAEPNYYFGDGPDIDAMREGNTWYVVFRDAWGDCSAGCIEERLFFFTVVDESQVTQVEPVEALTDPHFRKLVEFVRG